MFDLNDMDQAEEALMKLIGDALKRKPGERREPANTDDAPKCPFAREARA
ncbi:MAG: hypothetical protein AAFQ33_16430 [Pseudomonadota bacterium]